MLMGLDRAAAAEFSFFVAIPVLLVSTFVVFGYFYLHETLTFMAPLIADQALVGEYAVISQLLKNQVQKGEIDSFQWTDKDGKKLAPPAKEVAERLLELAVVAADGHAREVGGKDESDDTLGSLGQRPLRRLGEPVRHGRLVGVHERRHPPAPDDGTAVLPTVVTAKATMPYAGYRRDD
jgi:hypothetical protein